MGLVRFFRNARTSSGIPRRDIRHYKGRILGRYALAELLIHCGADISARIRYCEYPIQSALGDYSTVDCVFPN